MRFDLPVAACGAAAMFVAIVKANDFAALALREHAGDDGSAAQGLSIGAIADAFAFRVTVADKDNILERDLFAHGVWQPLDLDAVAFLDAILFVSGFND